MTELAVKTVAIVGTGVIGRGWMYVFARAGCRVNIYDQDPQQVDRALAWLDENMRQDIEQGFITDQEALLRRNRVFICQNLKEALFKAEYIQESCPENLEIKRMIYTKIDQTADASAIIASSTSTLNINDIAAGLPGISRCIMVHPANPPNLFPYCEVMPTKSADSKVIRYTIEFLKSVGQKPVIINFYLLGYIGARLQAALMREAIYLVISGATDVEGVDTALRDVLAPRWSLLGAFGVNNTNADGGIREYYSKFADTYKALMGDLNSTTPSFDSDMIEQVGKAVDAMEGRASIKEISLWRDRMIQKIEVLKKEDPHPGKTYNFKRNSTS